MLRQPARLFHSFFTASLARQGVAQRHAQRCVVRQLGYQCLQHGGGVGVFTGGGQQLCLHPAALLLGGGCMAACVDVWQRGVCQFERLTWLASGALALNLALLVVAVQGQQLRLLCATPLQMRQQKGQALCHSGIVLCTVQQGGVVELHWHRQRASALLQPVKYRHARVGLAALEPGIGHGIQQVGIVFGQCLGALQQAVGVGVAGGCCAVGGLCDQLVH